MSRHNKDRNTAYVLFVIAGLTFIVSEMALYSGMEGGFVAFNVAVCVLATIAGGIAYTDV